ncbi:MAG TPA: hypothetical protein VGG38_09590 [Acidimicrobiales bacterium]|jgi:hypothetical protein
MHPALLSQMNRAHQDDLVRLAQGDSAARTASPLHHSLHQTRRTARWLLSLARRIDPSVASSLSIEPSTLPSSILPTR